MTLSCYRCGASLAALTLPLARLDECPSCRVHLHVCRMCVSFDPRVAKSCTEDDAPEVRDKKNANFCDYFKPSADAYAADEIEAERDARSRLDALFGGAEPAAAGPATQPGSEERTADEHSLERAKSLFKD